jgi:hypothetical protein
MEFEYVARIYYDKSAASPCAMCASSYKNGSESGGCGICTDPGQTFRPGVGHCKVGLRGAGLRRWGG